MVHNVFEAVNVIRSAKTCLVTMYFFIYYPAACLKNVYWLTNHKKINIRLPCNDLENTHRFKALGMAS